MEESIENKIVRSERITLDNAVPGMVVTEAVTNEAGGVVLPADSILTHTHLDRLRELGIEHIYIMRCSVAKEFNPLRGMTAIVIDDSLFFRHMFGKMLYRMGMFVCEESETAEEGIRFAKKYKPDLVVVDIHLPKMDGVHAIAKLKKELPGVRLLAASVDKERHTVIDAIRAGAHYYLVKPVQWETLKPIILNILAPGAAHDLE